MISRPRPSRLQRLQALALTLASVLALASVSSRSSLAATHRHAASSGGGGPFGLGIELGEPTGLTGKYLFTSRRALDFGLSYSFNDFFLIYSDYLFQFPGAFHASDPFVSRLVPYVGIGGVLIFSASSNRKNQTYFTSNGSTAGLGIRIPLGIEWKPAEPPLGVFAQIVPGIGIVPSTFGFVEGGVGARYFF